MRLFGRKISVTQHDYDMYVNLYISQIERDITLGKLHVNKDGNYKKSISYGIDPYTGRRIRLQGEGATVEECARSLANQFKKINESNDKKTRPHYFKDVANEWYETNVKYSDTTERHKLNYTRDLENHILPKLGHFDMRVLKKKDYQNFLNSFEGKGESVVKKLRVIVKCVVNFAMENEYIPYNIMTLKIPKVKPVQKRMVLDKEKIKLLVKAQKEYPQAYTFLMMLTTGLRPSELYRVKYTDIDFERKTVTINESKTESGKRVLPIPNYMLNVIIEEKKQCIETTGITPEYVFHQQTAPNNCHTNNSLFRNWKTTLRYMDILNGAKVYRNKIVESTLEDKDRMQIYCLRHTYCTLLTNYGVYGYFRKRLMGHSLKNSITDEVYTHSSDREVIRHAQGFVNYLNDLLKEASDEYEKSKKK